MISYNPNYQSVVKELKPSTRQRFVTIDLNWPEEALETRIVLQETGVDPKTAASLVKSANKIRNLVHQGLEEGVSTRELVYAGLLLKSGVAAKDALCATLVESLTHDADLKEGITEVLKNYFQF